jgi:2-polyprenyl-3-methyl-5-hydroxy-6-metoxy-1,4-benzoquinol methylase
MFDAAKASQDLDDYLRTGYKKSSRPLFRLLDKLAVGGLNLLDIGGGIGAIPFELFNRGLARATHYDISPAYVQTFLAEASRRGLVDKVTSVEGDFTTLHENVPDADIVTLDKVICCYPDFESLVRHSSEKAGHWYVISLPREHWLVRIGMLIDYWLQKWRTGKAFRTYFHPVSKIIDQLERTGFRRREQVFQREWTALLFERI